VSDKETADSNVTGKMKINDLQERSKRFTSELPKIRKYVEQRDRIASSRELARHAKRATLIYNARRSAVAKFYDEFKSLCSEVRRTLDLLSGVLLAGESQALKSRIQLFRVEDTCAVLRLIAERFESRETRLQKFLIQNNCKVASIARSARVHKPDLQRWRHNELTDQSAMSQRIEGVLSGNTALVSAPTKPKNG
jgi:hypothetical protein